MSDKLLISTRKGLFTVARRPIGHWEIESVDFLGDNVSLTLTDPRDGRTYAALDHGHFGVKLHRSTANVAQMRAVLQLIGRPHMPERMWVQHHNGIFASSDESRTFTEITGVEPSTFGFAVAVHPRDPDTAWFVPEIKDEKRIPREGKLVVTRTRDAARHWTRQCTS